MNGKCTLFAISLSWEKESLIFHLLGLEILKIARVDSTMPVSGQKLMAINLLSIQAHSPESRSYFANGQEIEMLIKSSYNNRQYDQKVVKDKLRPSFLSHFCG